MLSCCWTYFKFAQYDVFCTVEGRTVRGCEEFDFCFGGRRQFCKSDYADLGELGIILTVVLPSLLLACHGSIQSRVYASVGCPSVCPSVGPQQQTSCCRFAAVGPASRRYQSIAA